MEPFETHCNERPDQQNRQHVNEYLLYLRFFPCCAFCLSATMARRRAISFIGSDRIAICCSAVRGLAKSSPVAALVVGTETELLAPSSGAAFGSTFGFALGCLRSRFCTGLRSADRLSSTSVSSALLFFVFVLGLVLGSSSESPCKDLRTRHQIVRQDTPITSKTKSPSSESSVNANGSPSNAACSWSLSKSRSRFCFFCEATQPTAF